MASSVSGTGVDGVAYNIAAGPLYFVRSGSFYLANTAGVLRYAGQLGYWWSSRGADTVWGSAGLGGYYLGFNANDVNPSNGPNTRWPGFPLRCLSTVLDM